MLKAQDVFSWIVQDRQGLELVGQSFNAGVGDTTAVFDGSMQDHRTITFSREELVL